MTTYTCNASRFTTSAQLQSAVGQLYHLGLSGPLGAAGANVYYGYLLKPDASEGGGFHQKSDVTSKEALTSYSSGNLIDRDLAFWPRVTDGDFSGGGYQEVWLQTNRYFDSDLDVRVPGYLQLRAQWTRATKPGLTVGSNFQTVAWNNDFWFTFGEANGNIYSASGGTTTTPEAAVVLALDSDGSYLYAGTAAKLWRSSDGVNWTAVTSAINGTASQWWVINQGTNGYFAYYQAGSNLLYKTDLTLALPIAAAAQVQVPVGGNAINIVDLVEYQTSIALLTVDVRGASSDVWYFDGTNLTRIVRIEGYHAHGMAACLGTLYVALHDHSGGTSPILAKIDSGSFEIVARPGSPFVTALNQSCLQPRAGGHYVYWPLLAQSINGISAAPGVILQYDTLSGALSHLPNQDASDFTLSSEASGLPLRALATMGDSLACCYVNGTTGVLQYQVSAFGTIKYQASGWLVSSNIDFQTPGVVKRFRRLEVHHSPLQAGEAILIECFVDQDPLSFTTALAPVPASQSGGSNSTVGSTVTSLTMGADTVGKTLYFALKLTAGSAQATTPRVLYVSIEVGGTWTWEVWLGCTSKRQLLSGSTTETQPAGKDLAYLVWLAYEQGAYLTLYHRNGQSYTTTIESCEFWNPSPQQAVQPQDMRDEEYIVHAVLRQVA